MQRREMARPMPAESARCAMLFGHSVEDGPRHTRGDRDAGLANAVALFSQKGMSTSQASRGWRPPSCCPEAIAGRSASTAKVGTHAEATPTSALQSPGGPLLARGADVHNRPPRSAVREMAGGRRVSACERCCARVKASLSVQRIARINVGGCFQLSQCLFAVKGF